MTIVAKCSVFVLVHTYVCLKLYIIINTGLLQIPVPMPAFPQQSAAASAAPRPKYKKPRNKKRMGEHVTCIMRQECLFMSCCLGVHVKFVSP